MLMRRLRKILSSWSARPTAGVRRMLAWIGRSSRNHPAIASVCSVLALTLALTAYLFPRSSEDSPPGFASPGEPAGAAATPIPSSQAPLSVVATINPVEQLRALGVDPTYIFDVPVDSLPPLPSGYDADPEIGAKWAYDGGGVDADGTYVGLVIQGRDAKSVVLTDVRIKVVRRDPPPANVAVSLRPRAEVIDGRSASVDLDQSVPGLDEMFNFTGNKEAWSFPLRVSETAVEVIHLWVHTTECDCRWGIELHFAADGRAGTIEINNNGVPFRTVASTNSTRYQVKDGKFVLTER